ncbi:MAG: AraC family transcriptional regulator [Gammaproteobacteria bacterium]|nr:AraC family transcriptional regulator [Gammaproteobacteria bacterium]
MSQIQTLILTVGGFQGFLLFTLLISDKRVNYASKLLGLLCLFIATTFVLPLIVAAEESSFDWLIGFVLFLPASYGALIYLYCRTAISGLPLKLHDLLHLLPLVICYLLNYDILFSPEKALSFVKMAETTLFRHTVTKVVFYGQSAFYAILLVRMLSQYHTQARQTLSSYNPNIFKWLWSLAAFTVSIWGLKVAFYFLDLSQSINTIADLLLVLMVYFIAIVQWRNSELFQIKQLTEEVKSQPTFQKGQSKPSNIENQPNGQLDEEIRSSVLYLVQQQVKEHALYRNSELTLGSLAEQIGVSVHQLSETLNQQGGKNFNQFINEFRVAEVCQQLENNSQSKLIDLALDAGFSSKSSFNAIFKKITGQTPSVYRQRVLSH